MVIGNECILFPIQVYLINCIVYIPNTELHNPGVVITEIQIRSITTTIIKEFIL